MIIMNRQPGLVCTGKACLVRAVPLHRRSNLIPVDQQPQSVEEKPWQECIFMGYGVKRRGKGELRVGHADLFPIIQARHAAHSHLQHVEQFRLTNIPAQANHAPVFIEIAENIDRHKGRWILLLHGSNQSAKVVCAELEIQHTKIEDQGQAGVLFLPQIEAGDCRIPGHFAYG